MSFSRNSESVTAKKQNVSQKAPVEGMKSVNKTIFFFWYSLSSVHTELLAIALALAEIAKNWYYTRFLCIANANAIAKSSV